MPEQTHKCFGCGQEIEDMGEHIHFGVDEWGQKQGLAPNGAGLDDLFQLTMCKACTEETEDGWSLEAHATKEKSS